MSKGNPHPSKPAKAHPWKVRGGNITKPPANHPWKLGRKRAVELKKANKILTPE